MKNKRTSRWLSSFIALFMVFSLLTPGFASANAAGLNKPSTVDESLFQMKQAILEQEELLSQAPRLHRDLEKEKGQHDVEVIIQLSEEPVALKQGKKKVKELPFTASERAKAQQKINAQQKQVKQQMKLKRLLVKEGYTFETVLNGFSATVKADDLEKLLAIKGVQLVEPVVEMHALEDVSTQAKGSVEPAMDTSQSFLGIENLWKQGLKGQGIKVGVLDTGIDYTHPEFDGVYKGGWNFIPNDSTYKTPRAEDDPYETTPLERPASMPEFNDNGSSFYTSHGTHVAGTIAAMGKNEFGISGLAPEVELYAYRVLGAYGSGSNAGVIAGINKAVEDGMDIINLSLGGGTNVSTTADSIAINNAMLAGVVSVVATGNSGPKRGTIGTPAAAALGIAVGNTTNPEAMYAANVALKAGDYTKESTLALMATTYGVDLKKQLNGEFEVVAVPGVGSASDVAKVDVAGKVALMARGEIAFVEKIAAAKEAGAVAAMIHNFAGGSGAPGISDVFLGDDFDFIPTFDMSQTEGDALRKALETNKGTVSFSSVEVSYTSGDEVNDSSSRGPTTPHFDIKPDVSAPGTNIMSTIPMYGKEQPDVDYSKAYTRKTGTSMATPHIAGIAALMMNANPDWTPFDIKVALSNTAKVLDTKKFDVFAQGPGRVMPYDAAFPKALAYALDTVVSEGVEVANHKGTVTFGHHPEVAEEDVTVEKQIKVKNLSGQASDYQVSVEVTKAFGQAKVTVDQTAFHLKDEQLLTVTLHAPKSEAPAGSELLGYIHLTNGETNLSLPFATDFSEASDEPITDYQLTETDLSFNGDGVQDEGRLEFTLNTDVTTNYVELWDVLNPDSGKYGDGKIGYLHASNSLAAGSYFLPINGKYTNWESQKAEQIPDGIYTVDLTALATSGNVISAWDGPLFVKSTPADIQVAEEHVTQEATYQLEGTVADAYIEFQKELEQRGLKFDVNTKLQTTYEVKDSNDKVLSKGAVQLAQDGTFTVGLTGLVPGEQTVTFTVNDAAGNQSEKRVVVVYESDEEVPEVPEEAGQHVVTPEEVQSQLKKNTKQIVLAIPAVEDQVNVEIDQAIVKTIVQSKANVLVTTQDGFAIELSRKAFEKLATQTKDTLTIVFTHEAATQQGAISDVYGFHFLADGQVVNLGKEFMDVTIPVDVTGIAKTNKLSVTDLEHQKTYKLKYKNGTATFKANGAGTFVAID